MPMLGVPESLHRTATPLVNSMLVSIMNIYIQFILVLLIVIFLAFLNFKFAVFLSYIKIKKLVNVNDCEIWLNKNPFIELEKKYYKSNRFFYNKAFMYFLYVFLLEPIGQILKNGFANSNATIYIFMIIILSSFFINGHYKTIVGEYCVKRKKAN